jgi:hypothetical protein
MSGTETDTSIRTGTDTGVQICAAFPFDVVDAGGHAEGGPGRHVVARVPLEEGAMVLAADAFVVGVFDSQRKRVCCGCAEVVPRRLAVWCLQCGTPHYCSKLCRVRDLRTHSVVCPVVGRLRSCKGGQDAKSTMVMLASGTPFACKF